METKALINLLVVGKRVYQKTPSRFRFIFFPIKLVFRLMYIFSTLKLDLWIITGKEKLSSEKLDILYGGKAENKNFLTNLAFKYPYNQTYIGKAWSWNLFKLMKKRGYDCSLIITEIHKTFRRLFDKKNYFFIPCWIPGEVDISVNSSLLIKNENLKKDVRRIRKNKLNFEITNDQRQFAHFYYNMYLPYISKVYDDSAIIWKYEDMNNEFKKCDLLLIKKEKEYIAGMLIVKTEYEPRIWVIAVKDGNSDYVKLGALQALYYFAVSYLKEQGHKRVSFGYTRAFLNDGVLRYKKKWHLELVGISKTGFLIKPLSRTPGTEAFFLNNPFIYTNKGRLNAAVFVSDDELFSNDFFGKIYKEYFFTGMSKLFIYRFGERCCGTEEISPPVPNDRMTICSAEDLF